MSSTNRTPQHSAGRAGRSGFEGRRVLVIGLLPHVNQSVVQPLLDLGVAAQGFTQPEQASERYNAKDFELIVLGRGVLGPLGDRLKRAFAEQNPDVGFVDAIHPVAVKQTLAALAHDPRQPRFAKDFRVVKEGADDRILATVLAPCRLTLTIFSVAEGTNLLAEVLADLDADTGAFERRTPGHRLAGANSLLLTANEEEYHLHPFLRGH
jgi:hypothetical protein